MKKAAFKFSVSADYAICTALLPFVLMLYQYQRNIIYLSISHVLAFSGIMAALLLVGYYTVKYLFKTEFGAFVFCVILFVSFFTYRSLIDPFFDLPAFLRMGGDMGRTIAYAARIVSIFIFTIAIAARIGSAKRLQKFNWHTARISIGIGGGYWNSEARIPIAASYQLSRFKELYHSYALQNKATMHISRKPGEILEVDWAGQTAHVVDTDTGEMLDAYVLVAALEAWPIANGGADRAGEAQSREKQYMVRGVAEAREQTLFVRDSGASYENLEFACGEHSRAKDTAEAFIFRNALGSEYTIVDNGFYAKLLAQFQCLPRMNQTADAVESGKRSKQGKSTPHSRGRRRYKPLIM